MQHQESRNHPNLLAAIFQGVTASQFAGKVPGFLGNAAASIFRVSLKLLKLFSTHAHPLSVVLTYVHPGNDEKKFRPIFTHNYKPSAWP